ncbi:O-antigen ligase family protein [Vibrio diazotrophicus]|uniref:O-antigen ligase family protein n=1 Tax=Vibrio diazotrophicus TaxID=685 RepID=UPI0005AA557E|nr:O-antigen ligase family protein [Vibrio diazotrophicus]
MNKLQLTQFVNALPFVWLFSGYLLVSNGQTYLAYFLILATLYNLLTGNIQKEKGRVRKSLILCTMIYIAVFLLNYIYTSNFWFVIRSSLYFLPFALTTPINKKTIVRTIYILPFTALALSVLYLIHSESRYLNNSGLNPIPLATVTALYLAFLLYLFFKEKDWKFNKFILFSGNLFCLYIIIRTESRGVWVAVALMMIVAVLYGIKTALKCKSYKQISGVFVFTIILGVLAASSISQRIDTTLQELTKIEQGLNNTSIGVRLELWRTSYQLIENNNFILPAKETDIHDFFKQKLADKKITKATLDFSPNAHNQYINSWLRSGLIGLFATLFLLIYPSIIVIKEYGFNSSILPLMIVTIILICGLTELPLTQISAYQAFLMSMLGSIIMLEQKE